MAPQPNMEKWLRSLYCDNILAVSRGGENVPSAFAEYGKKLMVDKILQEHRKAKAGPAKNTPVTSGVELLGDWFPANTETSEDE